MRSKHLHKERIPDLRIACYEYDDISRLPATDTMTPDDFKSLPSIQEQNRNRLIWHRSVIEAAYCIENRRDDYCDEFTSVCLAFDPKYILYRAVNDMGLRHYYRDMDSVRRGELLRRLNENNPRLELKELPKIGISRIKNRGETGDPETVHITKPVAPTKGKDNSIKIKGRSM